MQAKCLACQSNNVVSDVKMGGHDDTRICAMYKRRKTDWLISGYANILGEICNDCGNVRLYVKETNKLWVVSKKT
jgi:hypothetical protein